MIFILTSAFAMLRIVIWTTSTNSSCIVIIVNRESNAEHHEPATIGDDRAKLHTALLQLQLSCPQLQWYSTSTSTFPSLDFHCRYVYLMRLLIKHHISITNLQAWKLIVPALFIVNMSETLAYLHNFFLPCLPSFQVKLSLCPSVQQLCMPAGPPSLWPGVPRCIDLQLDLASLRTTWWSCIRTVRRWVKWWCGNKGGGCGT
jgi:hypothetical protein